VSDWVGGKGGGRLLNQFNGLDGSKSSHVTSYRLMWDGRDLSASDTKAEFQWHFNNHHVSGN
jgi:hypothetical protein